VGSAAIAGFDLCLEFVLLHVADGASRSFGVRGDATVSHVRRGAGNGTPPPPPSGTGDPLVTAATAMR
jgi:hypothetical protein